MKSIIVLILGILAALIVVGGVAGYVVMNEASSDYGGVGNLIHKIFDKLSNVETSDDGGSSLGSVGEKVKEEVVESGQEPGLKYRQVDYDDGGFRQYDVNTGELIGSSYESDQDKLPSME